MARCCWHAGLNSARMAGAGLVSHDIPSQASLPIIGHAGYLYEEFVRGVIVVNADIGHILRKRCVSLWRSDVIGCSGGFNAGDRVYVVMRTRDGSQFVLATGITRLDAAAFRPPRDSPNRNDVAPEAGGADAVVVREQDMALQWTRGS